MIDGGLYCLFPFLIADCFSNANNDVIEHQSITSSMAGTKQRWAMTVTVYYILYTYISKMSKLHLLLWMGLHTLHYCGARACVPFV